MLLPTSPRPGDTFRLSWVLGCLRRAGFRPEEACGMRETYEFRVDGDTFRLRVDDGVLDIRNGGAADPACVITTGLGTFLAIGARLVDIQDVAARGLARLEGELPAAARAIATLGTNSRAIGGRHGVVGAVSASFRPDHALGLREAYEFVVDGFDFHARVDDGTVEMDIGPAADAATTTVTDLGTLLQLGAGFLPLEDALSAEVGSVRRPGRRAADGGRLRRGPRRPGACPGLTESGRRRQRAPADRDPPGPAGQILMTRTQSVPDSIAARSSIVSSSVAAPREAIASAPPPSMAPIRPVDAACAAPMGVG